MKTIAIVGTSGLTATELIKLLVKHKEVKIRYLLTTSSLTSSQQEFDMFKKTYGLQEVELLYTYDEEIYKLLGNIDLVFLCLPHKVSMEFVKKLVDMLNEKQLPKIIDLSADFRIKNVKLYEQFYKTSHILPKLLQKFVYGLPEMNKKIKQQIKKANFVANPGCYPTTVILGLAPIVKFVKEVIVDAKSGYSGGGKKLVEEYEGYGGNNTYPYSASGEHRHIPEIEEQLSSLAQKNIKIVFTPHVVPQYQGMLTTIYIKVQRFEFRVQSLYKKYKNYYKNCPFVKILPMGSLPQTKNVIKTNFCEIGFAEHNKWIKIFVAIDNLIKGAVGQAVQNMNLMFGFDETEGLR
jgi:N-acetyl-gamma-glutamyl-phosphate reductase